MTYLKDQELEEKILQNASEWISKSKLCGKIPCDKKRCFDRIKLMIPMQLKEKPVKNRLMVCRIDTANREQFEYSLKFQKDMLELQRDELKKYPKPMFYFNGIITHYKPPLILADLTEAENRKRTRKFNNDPKFRKTFKIDEEIKIWKTRKPNVRKTLENMKFYYQGLFIFISRAQLQKSLGIISTKEANMRIKKCEKVFEEHFKILLSENPKDNEAIRQFHEYGHGLTGTQYDIGSFRI